MFCEPHVEMIMHSLLDEASTAKLYLCLVLNYTHGYYAEHTWFTNSPRFAGEKGLQLPTLFNPRRDT